MCKKVVASGVILNKTGRILLSKKRDSGLYCPPGGKVEKGELIVQGLVRELQEECGITAIEPVLMGHRDMEDKVIFFYLITRWLGEIQDLEPEKHGHWQFHLERADKEVVEGMRLFKEEIREAMYKQWEAS